MFDAEGCFCIYQVPSNGSANYPYFTANAVINIREREVCELFKTLFGGYVGVNIKRDEAHSTTYVWKVSAKQLRFFVECIKEFLILKRAQAEVIESLFRIRGDKRTTRKITSWEFVQMYEHQLEMNRLNQTGIGKDEISHFPSQYGDIKLIKGENYNGK